MRWLTLVMTLVGFCGLAQAREPLARPMARTPSIMVGGEAAEAPRTVKRRQATRPQATRARAPRTTRARSTPLPRASGAYEARTGSINRSISRQQQDLQREQGQQIQNNLLRQEIRRSTTSPIGLGTRSPGCSPGLIGC